MTFTEADNGSTRQVGVGADITVILAENPTTGFRWQVRELDESTLSLRNSSFRAGGASPGAGGRRVFVFHMHTTGESCLHLALVRAWDDSLAGTFDLHLVAQT